MLGISLSTLRGWMRREAHVLEEQVNTAALACSLQRRRDGERESEIRTKEKEMNGGINRKKG